jgi:hypothetical protein
MGSAARKNIIVTAVLLLITGMLATEEMYRFYKPSNLLFSASTVSLIMVFALLFLLFRKAGRIAEHPVFSWVLVSCYLITAVVLLFPNTYIDRYYLYFLGAVIVSGFNGADFGITLLMGTFGIVLIQNGASFGLLVTGFLSFVSVINAASNKKMSDFLKTSAGTAVIEGVLVLLTGMYLKDRSFYITGGALILLYTLISVFICYLRSQDTLIWDAFNYSIFEEEEVPAAVTAEAVTVNGSRVFTIQELCDTENVLFASLQSKLPRTADRDMKTSFLAREVAGNTGADLELVQCACLYRNIGRLFNDKNVGKDGETFEDLNIPANLKALILKESSDQFRPANFEEIIVYTVCETVNAFYYFRKQKADFTVEQLVESICKLLLQKGVVRDCMLPMSLFHRMKQAITEHFRDYFN